MSRNSPGYSRVNSGGISAIEQSWPMKIFTSEHCICRVFSSLRLIRIRSDYCGIYVFSRRASACLSTNFSRCQQFLDEIGASGCEAAGVARKWRWWKMTGRRPGWGSLWLVPSIDPVSSSMKLPGRLRREWLLARRCRGMGKRDRGLESALGVMGTGSGERGIRGRRRKRRIEPYKYERKKEERKKQDERRCRKRKRDVIY